MQKENKILAPIMRWFKSLIGILFVIGVIFPVVAVWMVLKIVSLGEMNWKFPAEVDSKLMSVLEKIIGSDHWLFS